MVHNDEILAAKNGSKESIEKIIKIYQRCIYKNNQKFFLRGGDREDLIQEGTIGLLKAIKSYNNDKNTSFNTFANLCIKRQIITAVQRDNSDKNKFLNQALGKENSLIINEFSSYVNPSSKYLSPEDILLKKELINYLHNIFNKTLSPLEKNVFIYLCKQYSYIEIARILNEEPKRIDNTIQRIKRKALIYLKKYL